MCSAETGLLNECGAGFSCWTTDSGRDSELRKELSDFALVSLDVCGATARRGAVCFSGAGPAENGKSSFDALLPGGGACNRGTFGFAAICFSAGPIDQE